MLENIGNITKRALTPFAAKQDLTPKIVIGIGVAIVVCVAVLFYLYPMKPLMLVTEGAVPVFETKSDAMASSEPKPIAVLSVQQSVEVVKCVDVKHYFIYKVRLPDGRTGYVNVGDYVLQRDSKPYHC